MNKRAAPVRLLSAQSELGLDLQQRKLTRRQAQSMVLYRVHVCGSRIKNIAAPLPPFCSLVGWDDEGGDPVFVAVLPPKDSWRRTSDSDIKACAIKTMIKYLTENPGEPDYFFPDAT